MSEITQNQLTEALTSSVQKIAQAATEKKAATLTIEAEIVKIVDAGLGIYNVKYQNNIFEASATNTEVAYEVGDKVYIIVPNGNFDRQKIILSLVTPSKAVYANNEGEVTRITVGDNLFKYIPDIALCTYDPHTADDEDSLLKVDITGFSAMLQSALKDSKIFNFSCKIQTKIEQSRRSGGNYGLILDLPVTQIINGVSTNKYYSITIDVKNMTGDPYDFQVPALQNLYFALPEDMTYYDNIGLPPRIRSFVTGFLGVDDTKPDDIFITDIQLLSTLEVSAEEMSGYYALITASNGYSFLASRTGDIKTLSVSAYFNGKITKLENFDCYWFKENSLITALSDKFQHFGGVGWEVLNSVSKKNIKEDGTYNYEYITNKYDYTIKQNDLHCDTRFKCILVKKDVVISSIVTIRNLASPASLKLTTLSGGNNFATGVGDVRLQLAFKESGITDVVNPNFIINYSWQRLNKIGEFIDNDFFTIEQLNKREDDSYYTIIKFPVSEIDEINTIGCTVYVDTPSADKKSIKRQTIGTVWLTIGTEEYAGGHISLVNGDKLYKYDADGDSPMVSDYDGPISSTIKNIDPIMLNIFKEDGTELSADEYKTVTVYWLVPINSMIEIDKELRSDILSNKGYYTISGSYDTKKILSYKIAASYSKNKNDNTIIIKASAPKAVLKNTLIAKANIRFLKDGESGTNGSKYSAVITYKNSAYGEKAENGKYRKLQLIYANDTKTWYLYDPAEPYNSEEPNNFLPFSKATLKAKLYTDGVVTESPLSIVWSIFDSNYSYNEDAKNPIAINSSSGEITLKGDKWTDGIGTFCTTVQARIRARRADNSDISITDSEEYVYAYYPIECTYVAKYEYLKNNVPTLEGGFDKVLYASDGTNPQYDNSRPFIVSDALGDLSTTITDVHAKYEYAWTSSVNLTDSAVKDLNGNIITNQRKVIPATKYDNGVAKNYLRVSLQMTDDTQADLNIKKTNLENNKTKATKYRNYLSLLRGALDIFEKFNYNNYIQRLVNINNLFILKTNLNNTINILFKDINEIIIACETYQKEDVALRNLAEVAKIKLEDIITLQDAVATIGISETSLDDILRITGDSLIIDQIDYDYIQNRYYRISVIDAINNYNNAVQQIYNIDYNKVMQTDIKDQDEAAREVFNEIIAIANSDKMTTLCSTVDGINNESYRYTAIKETILSRINNIGNKDSNINSYSDIVNQVLNPILDSIKYYQNNKNLYDTQINDLNKQIQDYDQDSKIIDDMMRPLNSVFIIHAKPIIMITNRYEMSNINGWDGNKLEISEDEGYILAPQIGTGIKDSNNTFTGVVMGVKQVAEKATGIDAQKQKIGILGYYQGAQSMFLNAKDGSAIFGLNNAGQITIDPTASRNGKKVGLLYSTNFWKKFKFDGKPDGYTSANYNNDGMLIDFVTPEIRYGNGNFIVNSYGHITAVGGGTIAGWEIGEQDFYQSGYKTCAIYTKAKANEGRMVIDSGAIKTRNNNGNIDYTVKHAGRIFTGQHNSIQSTANGFYLSQDGMSISNGENRFEINVSNNGKYPIMYANRHSSLESKTDGWYIGPEGFSIAHSWNETDASGGTTTHNSSFKIALNTNNQGPELISNGHVFGSNRPGFYLGQKGLSISSDTSRIEINTVGEPTIYSGRHNTLTASNDGFYLGNDGMSIGSKLFFGADGYVRIGRGATRVDGSKRRCWTIDGVGTSGDVEGYSYIGYNIGDDKLATDFEQHIIGGRSGEVYLGTDGMRLGNKFAVGNNGKLIARELYASTSGIIAGWKIEETRLTSNIEDGDDEGNKGYYLEIDSDGELRCKKGSDKKWYINKKGDAYFRNLKIDGTFTGNATGEFKLDGWNFTPGHIAGGGINLQQNKENASKSYIQVNDLFIGGDAGAAVGTGTSNGILFDNAGKMIELSNIAKVLASAAKGGTYKVKKDGNEIGEVTISKIIE